jgi:hypothetical protein
MKTINIIVLSLVALFGFALFAVSVSNVEVLAQTEDYILDGIDKTGTSTGDAEDSVDNVVATVVNFLSWLIGVVSVIFVLWGGFKYVTSSGESGKTSQAKNTIIYALIGLVIAALAQILVRFVLAQVA